MFNTRFVSTCCGWFGNNLVCLKERPSLQAFVPQMDSPSQPRMNSKGMNCRTRLGFLFLLCFTAGMLHAQNAALLELAFTQKSDSIMQLFLQSCDAAHKPAPPAWEYPEDEFLRTLLRQAALDGGVFPEVDYPTVKAHRVSIPCFWLGQYWGYPPPDYLCEGMPTYECDLRFLEQQSGLPILWVDRSLDSIFCNFLDAAITPDYVGSYDSDANERLRFLGDYFPFHLDGIGYSDPMVEEIYFDMARRPYCEHDWNYASEPMLTAVNTDGRRWASVILNQEWRKDHLIYRRHGKRWFLVEWYGSHEPEKIKFPASLFHRSNYWPKR